MGGGAHYKMYRRLKTYAALPAVVFTICVGCLPLDMNDQIRQLHSTSVAISSLKPAGRDKE
jgi:hypothetical protein